MSENAATNDPLTVRGLQRLLLGNVVRTGRRFATGAFGSVVEELEMDGLICAGKQLHTPLPSHDGCTLAEELSRLFDLRHPNIVQLLGICFLHDTETIAPRCPHIVMEYLPHCLDNLLNHASGTPLSVKHSILCDVAAGLSYLHNRSPPVVHCKLTASNVLLTSGMEAKICDIRVQGVSWQPSCSHVSANYANIPHCHRQYMTVTGDTIEWGHGPGFYTEKGMAYLNKHTITPYPERAHMVRKLVTWSFTLVTAPFVLQSMESG